MFAERERTASNFPFFRVRAMAFFYFLFLEEIFFVCFSSRVFDISKGEFQWEFSPGVCEDLGFRGKGSFFHFLQDRYRCCW